MMAPREFAWVAVAIGLTAATTGAAQNSADPLPEWMAGCWTSQEGERWSEECWMHPRGGMMLGASRSGTGERVAEWEALRIEKSAEGLAYRASPQGQGWTTFVSAPSATHQSVTFVNPAHDYPQRIRYWREGALLKAEIARADGSRAREWSFAPAQR